MNNKRGRCIVICTCPDQEIAQTIANTLVKQSLAACVNIIDKVHSIYLWQGEIQRDNEILLLIKSRYELFTKLEQLILELHPYELPEIIAVSVETGNKNYLHWIDQNCKE